MEKKGAVRILCLHGMKTNAKIMEFQLARILGLLDEGMVEAVCMDAPMLECEASDPVTAQVFPDQDYFSWFAKQMVLDGTTGDHPGTLRYALDAIKRFVASNGPFHALCGFSQGAQLVCLITALYEHSAWQMPGLERIHFTVLLCGNLEVDLAQRCCKALDMEEAGGFLLGAVPITTPSVHLHGECDPMLARSQSMITMYSELTSEVFMHTQGHKVPMKSDELRPVVHFIRNAIQQYHLAAEGVTVQIDESTLPAVRDSADDLLEEMGF